MKSKVTAGILTVMERVLCLLFAVQIVFAFVWAAGNIGSVPAFHETEELLEIADTLVTDDYVGILYPMLIRVVRLADGVLLVPYYVILYIAQTILLFWAVYRATDDSFVRQQKKYRILYAAAVVTIPAVWQCCFAVLPQALALASLLLCYDKARRGKWLSGSIFWLVSALCIPACGYFGGVLLAGMLLLWYRKKGMAKKELYRVVLLAAAVCAVILGSNRAVAEEHSRGRMANTLSAALVHRFVWPNFENTKYFWPEEVREVLSDEALYSVSKQPGNVYSEFGYQLEEVYGTRRMQAIYRDMAVTALGMHTRKTTAAIARDLLLYSLPPIEQLCGLEGKEASYSGWNYSRMTQRMPLVTKYYVRFAGRLFVVALGCLVFGRLRSGRRLRCTDRLPLYGTAALQVCWYTMAAAGMQDSRNVLLVCVLWGLAVTHSIELTSRYRRRFEISYVSGDQDEGDIFFEKFEKKN